MVIIIIISQVQDLTSEVLTPHQLGFGVAQGAECSVHVARIFTNNLTPH